MGTGSKTCTSSLICIAAHRDIAESALSFRNFQLTSACSFELNSNFGSADDLRALASALHSRDMYLMVDVVANDMVSNPSYRVLQNLTHLPESRPLQGQVTRLTTVPLFPSTPRCTIIHIAQLRTTTTKPTRKFVGLGTISYLCRILTPPGRT